MLQLYSRLTCLMTLICLSSACIPLESEPHEDTQRRIHSGQIRGSLYRHNTHVWRGIPYADAPVGVRRWRAPKPPAPWPGTRDMLEFGSMCPQVGGRLVTDDSSLFGTIIGDEDCLSLNVYAPAFSVNTIPRGSERLPVMVWIHGGANRFGSGDFFDPSVLVDTQELIVLTLNYRLGVFGTFRHPSLSALNDNPADISGNFALLDIIEALSWVQRNIAAFGGDPNRVTVFGESSGAYLISGLLVTPLAQDLFHAAIIQSGTMETGDIQAAESPADSDETKPVHSSIELVNHLLIQQKKVANREAAMALQNRAARSHVRQWLLDASPKDLIIASHRYRPKYRTMPLLFPDGHVIPEAGIRPHLMRYGAAVPIMIGHNRDEMRFFNMFNPNMVDRFGYMPYSVKDWPLYEAHSDYGSLFWQLSGVDEPVTAIMAGKKSLGRADLPAFSHSLSHSSPLPSSRLFRQLLCSSILRLDVIDCDNRSVVV